MRFVFSHALSVLLRQYSVEELDCTRQVLKPVLLGSLVFKDWGYVCVLGDSI